MIRGSGRASAQAPRARGRLHGPAGVLAAAFAALPRRWRFHAAAALAPLLVPVLSRTTIYRALVEDAADGPRDAALALLLSALTQFGVRFDPLLRLTGERFLLDALDESDRTGCGVLLVTPHAGLCIHVLRHFRELGRTIVSISAHGRPIAVPGAEAPPTEVIPPGPHALLAVRRELRAGRVVGAMIVVRSPTPAHTRGFVTRAGQMHLAPALLHIAARVGAPVVFLTARAEARRVRLIYGGSPRGRSGDEIEDDLIAFLRAESGLDDSDEPTLVGAPGPRHSSRPRASAG